MKPRLSTLLVAALCGASGCDRVRALIDGGDESSSGVQDEPETPAEAPAAAEGYVVLEHDAALHRRPSPDAPALTLAFDDEARAGRRFAAFERVETQGGWVRVQPLSADEGKTHCAGSWAPLHDFDVSLWVKDSDLVSVLQSGTLSRDAEGGSAMLAAGTPLEPGSTGSGVVRVPQLGIQAEIPASSIGTTYDQGPLFPVPDPIAARPLDQGPLRFHGDAIDTQAFELTTESPPRLPVHVRKEEDGKTIVGVGTRCAELRVREPGSTAWLDDPAPPKRTAPTEAPAPRTGAWTVRAGAEVFWPDMEPAGTVRADHVFEGDPTSKSDKRCFEFGAGWSRICVRADDLTRIEPPAADPTPAAVVEVSPPEPEDPSIVAPPEPEDPPVVAPPEPEDPPIVAPPEPEDPEPEDPAPTGEPSVSVFKAQITGPLDRQSVAHVLKLHRSKALACYTSRLKDAPTLAGSIQLVLTISPEGAVKSVKARQDKLGDADLRQCLLEEAKGWGFKRPTGGGLVVVKQTLKFSPG